MKALIRKAINAMNRGFDEEAEFLRSLSVEQRVALDQYKINHNIW